MQNLFRFKKCGGDFIQENYLKNILNNYIQKIQKNNNKNFDK